MDNKRYFLLILILGGLTALGPFSIDMYLPGFSAIAADLHTSEAKVSLSLTGFFIGISAGQLLYGPLLDRFGRKRPLAIGLCVYVVASICCALVHSINALIVLRFVQAIGSCAAAVASVAMVRDLFPVKDSAKVFSLLILVVGASPMIAPTVGGYITDFYGWHAVFIVLSVMGAGILAASLLWLPNSFVPDKTLSLKPAPIINGFWAVFKTPQFYTYTFTGAFAFAGLFAYVAGSPIVFMTVFGVSGKVYGWIFAALSVGFIGSSQVNTLLMRRFKSEQIIRGALLTYLAVGILFFTASQMELLNLPTTIGFLFCMLCCVGICNPNTSSLTLAPFSKNAGSASALMGAIQMGIGALVTVFISLFDKPSTKPMVVAIIGAAIISNLVFFIGKRNIKQVAEASGDAVVLH